MDHSKHTPLTRQELNEAVLANAPVYGADDRKIGTISHVHGSGATTDVVVDVGGFLGIGTRFHPLPWGALKYDTAKEGYVVDLDKKTLAEAPTTEAFDTPLWEDELWNRKVYDYYKQPFWRE